MNRIEALVTRLIETEDPSEVLAEGIEKLSEENLKDAMSREIETMDSAVLASVNNILSPYVSMLVKANVSEDELYRRACSLLTLFDSFSKEDVYRVAIISLLGNPSIPYRKLDLVTMGNDEFRDRIERLDGVINEIIALSRREYDQMTEKGSAILDVVESVDDRRDRSILLGIALNYKNDASS